jgi:hypothetical protein
VGDQSLIFYIYNAPIELNSHDQKTKFLMIGFYQENANFYVLGKNYFVVFAQLVVIEKKYILV